MSRDVKMTKIIVRRVPRGDRESAPTILSPNLLPLDRFSMSSLSGATPVTKMFVVTKCWLYNAVLTMSSKRVDHPTIQKLIMYSTCTYLFHASSSWLSFMTIVGEPRLLPQIITEPINISQNERPGPVVIDISKTCWL